MNARERVAQIPFLQWSTQFSRNEMKFHHKDHRIMLFSTRMSMRFLYSHQDDVAFLFVQPPESWLIEMAIELATVSDRLYLMMNGSSIHEGLKLPRSGLGIELHGERSLEAFRHTKRLHIHRATLNEHDKVNWVSRDYKFVPLREDYLDGGLDSNRGTKPVKQRVFF